MFAVILTLFYTIPTFSSAHQEAQKTQKIIDNYQTLEAQGLDFKNLSKHIHKSENFELQYFLEHQSEDIKNIIKNPSNKKYKDWLQDEEKNATFLEKTINENEQKISTIIPNLAQNKHQKNAWVTLKMYIEFIEKHILSQFHITSYAPIGIDAIGYFDEKITKNSLGYIDTQIIFDEATNGDISKLLIAVKNSGSPDIFEKSHDEISHEIMSNPLVTVESLELKNPLNTHFPNVKNSGKITLRFYIRGSTPSDRDFIEQNFLQKKDALKNQITQALNNCIQSEPNCENEKNLQTLQDKVVQFEKNINNFITKKKKDTVAYIYFISEQFETLNALENELYSLTK